MAKIHAIHANGSLPRPTLWHKMHNYFTLVKNEISPRYEIGEGSRRRRLCHLRVIPPPFFWLRPPNRVGGASVRAAASVSKQSWADQLSLGNLDPQLHTCVLSCL